MKTAAPPKLEPRRHERTLQSLTFRAAPAEGEPAFPPGIIGRVQAVLLRYGVVDDRGTLFKRGCIDKTRAQKVPAGRVALFANMDSNGSGFQRHGTRTHVGVVRTLTDAGDDVLMSADIFDTAEGRSVKEYLEAVLASGAHTGASIGFVEREGEVVEIVGADGVKMRAYQFEEIELYEGTIVPLSSVPGTEVLAVRSTAALAEEALRAIVPVIGAERALQIVSQASPEAPTAEARADTRAAAPEIAATAPEATMEERRAALAAALKS